MAAPFESVLPDVEEAFKKAVRAFAEWHAAENKMTRAEWLSSYADPPPEGDYFDGYNAGVESALMMMDLWLEELI